MAYIPDDPRLPRSLAAVLFSPVPVFIGLNLIMGTLLFFGGSESLIGFLRFFDLNAEQTVPAWYSTVLLALAALVSAVVALAKHADDDPFIAHWYGLIAIFAYLSMDEALAIHERAIGPVGDLIQVGGLLHFAWVVPGAIGVAVVGLIYLRFLAALPRRLARNIIIAGAVYVGGALILEMVGGLLFELYGPGVQTDLVSMLEEVAEMSGIIWYIYALADHMLTPAPPRSAAKPR